MYSEWKKCNYGYLDSTWWSVCAKLGLCKFCSLSLLSFSVYSTIRVLHFYFCSYPPVNYMNKTYYCKDFPDFHWFIMKRWKLPLVFLKLMLLSWIELQKGGDKRNCRNLFSRYSPYRFLSPIRQSYLIVIFLSKKKLAKTIYCCFDGKT